MGMEFDLDDVDPSKLSGHEKLPAGRYHVAVLALQTDAGKDKDSIVADLQVQAGTNEEAIGKTHREYFQQVGKGKGRTLMLAIAAGLTTKEAIEACKAARRGLVIHWDDAPGKHLCVGIEKEEYPKGSGKFNSKVNFDICAIGSPEAAGIPINEETYKASLGQGGGDGGAPPPDPFANLG